MESSDGPSPSGKSGPEVKDDLDKPLTQRELQLQKINRTLLMQNPAELNKRQKLNRLLNDPNSGYGAALVSVFLTALILLSVILMVISTVKGYRDSDGMDWLPYELIITTMFTIELGIRCAVQYDTLKAVSVDIYFYIDILAVIPFWVEFLTGAQLPEVLKAVRIVRLFKLFRQFQGTITLAAAIEESLSALSVPFFFLVVSATTFGVVMYYVEKVGSSLQGTRVDSAFMSIPHAIWFIFVTMTTVGYGDIYPNSTLGKVINIFAMLFGVLFLSMPLAILGNNFVNVWAERDRFTLIARLRETLMAGGVNKESVTNAFSIIDLDGSGCLNYKEFQQALTMLKIEMPAKKLRRLWTNIDTDGSGEIRVEEFAELLFPEVETGDDAGEEPAVIVHNEKSFSIEELDKTTAELRSLNLKVEDQAREIRSLKSSVDRLVSIIEQQAGVVVGGIGGGGAANTLNIPS